MKPKQRQAFLDTIEFAAKFTEVEKPFGQMRQARRLNALNNQGVLNERKVQT